MKYFAVLLRTHDNEKATKYRSQHIDYISKMQAENRIFAYGRLGGDAGGLLIYKGESEEEIRQYVEKDPHVVYKARDIEIYEWDMVLSD